MIEFKIIKTVMKILIPFCFVVLAISAACGGNLKRENSLADTILVSDTIQYHPVRISKADGSILPWFSADLGASYDTVLMLVWNFWNKMESDSNGLKYYMNHQVWKPEHDMRGLGGDQINMALSSWRLLYQYTGYPEVAANMRYLADTYLERSLSAAGDKWPYLPYPYNTVIHSGIYDGDMRNGKYITQPDKAGNFGYELVNLYKMTGEKKYLESAQRIAATLMSHLIPGDSLRSPLPFRVNARTGESGFLFSNNMSGMKVETALYTSNWTCTMELFKELEKLDQGKSQEYKKAFNLILAWMKNYPLRTNKWGPFFEDIPGWSDTQTNAISMAMFIINHRELFPEWQKDILGIFDWTYKELGNHEYEKYHVTAMNEQTVYRVPGNSHSSRQASVELMYTSASGDTTYKANAIRTLSWATYTVAHDGRNRYIRDDIWLTDGYGDYVRHYLRAMAAMPELAPANRDRLLASTSVITKIEYKPDSICYMTFDPASEETLRLMKRPKKVAADGNELSENNKNSGKGWTWKKLEKGGVLTIIKGGGPNVVISF
jgi:hypothetical protein